MELYLDLGSIRKSKKKGHLVPRKVPVQGQDGQVHYAIRYVNPNKDKDSEKDVSIQFENLYGEEFHVEISNEKAEALHEEFDGKQFVDVYSTLREDRELKVADLTPELTKELQNEARAIIKVVEEFNKLKVDLENNDYVIPPPPPIDDSYLEEQARNRKMREVSEYIMEDVPELEHIKDISRAWPSVQRNFADIEDVLTHDIENSDSSNYAKIIQKQALRDGNMEHKYSHAFHPDTARDTVNEILGEDKANQARELMKDASLSINFNSDHVNVIAKDGYIPSTDETFAERNLDEEEFERYLEFKGEENSLDELDYLDIDSSVRMDLSERAGAEHEAIGLELGDDKPIYIAFNPFDNPTGGASSFGDAWLKVKDPQEILNESTLTISDSFHATESFSKVYNMDHLKDIFILKQLTHIEDMWNDEEPGIEWGLMGDVTVPLELQYHQSQLEPEQFEIVDTMPEEEKYKMPANEDLDTDMSLDELMESIIS